MTNLIAVIDWRRCKRLPRLLVCLF